MPECPGLRQLGPSASNPANHNLVSTSPCPVALQRVTGDRTGVGLRGAPPRAAPRFFVRMRFVAARLASSPREVFFMTVPIGSSQTASGASVLRVGHIPAPDDAFMFYGLASGEVRIR